MSQATSSHTLGNTTPQITEHELERLIEQRRRRAFTKRRWALVSDWNFDFGKGTMTREERFIRIEECLMVIADLSAILDSVDVPRVIEHGYDLALHRFGNVLQMMAITAHSLLDEYDPDEEKTA